MMCFCSCITLSPNISLKDSCQGFVYCILVQRFIPLRYIFVYRLADLNQSRNTSVDQTVSLMPPTEGLYDRSCTSHELTVSTGCHQGGGLSLVLFSLFTIEFQIKNTQFKLLKQEFTPRLFKVGVTAVSFKVMWPKPRSLLSNHAPIPTQM